MPNCFIKVFICVLFIPLPFANLSKTNFTPHCVGTPRVVREILFSESNRPKFGASTCAQQTCAQTSEMASNVDGMTSIVNALTFKFVSSVVKFIKCTFKPRLTIRLALMMQAKI